MSIREDVLNQFRLKTTICLRLLLLFLFFFVHNKIILSKIHLFVSQRPFIIYQRELSGYLYTRSYIRPDFTQFSRMRVDACVLNWDFLKKKIIILQNTQRYNKQRAKKKLCRYRQCKFVAVSPVYLYCGLAVESGKKQSCLLSTTLLRTFPLKRHTIH